MSEMKYIKDRNDNIVLPITSTKAVRNEQGTNIDTLISNVSEDLTAEKAKIANKVDKATTLAGYGITDGYTKTEGQALETQVTNAIDSVQDAVNLLNGNEVVVVDDHTTVNNPDGQKIYREKGSNSYTDWMYQDSSWKKIATYTMPGFDDTPMKNSEKIVKSSGVFKAIQDDAVFDVSAHNLDLNQNPTPYESLALALAAVPTDYKKGGMSIKFIKQDVTVSYRVVNGQSQGASLEAITVNNRFTLADGNTYSANDILTAIENDTDKTTVETAINSLSNNGDSMVIQYDADGTTYATWTITKNVNTKNEYVQYRFLGATTDGFTNVANWQGVDDKPTAESNNLVKSNGIFESQKSIKSQVNKQTFYAKKAVLSLSKSGKYMNADGTYTKNANYDVYNLLNFTNDQIIDIVVFIKGYVVPMALLFNSNNEIIKVFDNATSEGAYEHIRCDLTEYPTASYLKINTYKYSTHNPMDISSINGTILTENYPEKIDGIPTEESLNLVKSGGVYNALDIVKKDILIKPVCGFEYNNIVPTITENQTLYKKDGTTVSSNNYTTRIYELPVGTVVKIKINKNFSELHSVIAYRNEANEFNVIVGGAFSYANSNDFYITITSDIKQLIVTEGDIVGVEYEDTEDYVDILYSKKKNRYYVNEQNEIIQNNYFDLYFFNVKESTKMQIYTASVSGAYCLFVDANDNMIGTPFKPTATRISEWLNVSVPEGAVMLKVSYYNGTIYPGVCPIRVLANHQDYESTLRPVFRKTVVNVGMSIWWLDGTAYRSENTIDGEGTLCKGYQTWMNEYFNFPEVVKYTYSGASLGVGNKASSSIMYNYSSEWTAHEDAIWTLDTITNDFGRNVPLGTPSDFDNATGITTYYGALRAFKDRVAELTTNAIIVCSNSLYRDGNKTNSSGLTLEDYEEALCYAAAKSGWFFVDQFRNSINEHNYHVALYDGLHPTNFGFRLAVKPWIEQFDIIQKTILK